MKRFPWLVVIMVMLLSALAFIPALAFPWNEKFSWQDYALAYQHDPVVFVVDTTADTVDVNIGDGICSTYSGKCSLRAAIQEANRFESLQADVIIQIPAGTYSLTIFDNSNYYHLNIHRESIWNVVLQGQGAESTIIQGNGLNGVLKILYSATFSDLTITNGGGTYGAIDILNESMLTMKNSTVGGNSSTSDGGGIRVGYYRSYLILENSTVSGNTGRNGGGIFNDGGQVIIRQSTISNNVAENSGGGIVNTNDGTLVLENSTVSGNFSAHGSGIHQKSGSTTYIFNSTITNNSASLAAGGIGLFDSYSGTVFFSNTILAGNHNLNSPDCAIESGALVSWGYNLVGSTVGCPYTATTSDQVNKDALLGVLTNNGGQTKTHALLATSPAINGGNPNGCLGYHNQLMYIDQRGFPRQGGFADAICDIGSFEVSSYLLFLPITRR